MTPHSVNAVFADLQSGRGQFEETLEESADEVFRIRNLQQLVEFFVGLPVVTRVEQVDGHQETAVVGPGVVGERPGCRALLLVAVSLGMTVRVRSRRSGNEGVGGKVNRRQQPGRVLECLDHR